MFNLPIYALFVLGFISYFFSCVFNYVSYNALGLRYDFFKVVKDDEDCDGREVLRQVVVILGPVGTIFVACALLIYGVYKLIFGVCERVSQHILGC